MDFLLQFSTALSIGFACIWVAVGQGYLTMKAMRIMGRDPNMQWFYLTVAILWIALVESAAIYGLIMWFQILTHESIAWLTALGVGFAIWLTGLWVWIWEGKMLEWAFSAMNKNPYQKNKIMSFMILFLALIESAAIYGLVVGYNLLSNSGLSPEAWLAAGLSVGLAGIGVAIGEGMLAKKCLETIADDEKNSGFYLTLWVLGVALVESALIYSLIISFNIISENIWSLWIIWASLAIWLAAIWVWVWEGKMITACFDAIKDNSRNKSKILTFMILFIALIESAAIYGLIVAFQVIATWIESQIWLIWAGLAVWLAGLWVWIWEWFVAYNAIKAIWSDKENSNFYLTLSILWIALVESAAIYGLIIAFQIIGNWDIVGLIGAWLAIGLAGLWVWIWEGKMVSGAIQASNKNPKIKKQILTYMILFLALIESAAIYGLILSLQIISSLWISEIVALAVGVAIGFAGLWVGIWEWILAKQSLVSMSQNPDNQKFYLVSTILLIALVESAAIYALIMWFQFFTVSAIGISALWVALWIGLAWLWVGIWEWILAKRSLQAMGEFPENKNLFLTLTILGVALVESVAIYALIVWFQIIGAESISHFKAIAMWLAVGLTGLWVAYGEAKLLEWAISSISHHPERKNRIIPYMILFLALVESAAIYGLIVAFQIWSSGIEWFWLIWVWLAVWLAWLWVWIWEGLLVNKSIQLIGNDPESSNFYLTVTILSIALVESAAIYWLIISVQLLWTPELIWFWAIGAWLAIGLAWLWVGIWEWHMVRWALDSIRLNKKYRKQILVYMILFIALVESVAIYALVISSQIITNLEVVWILWLSAAIAIGLAWLWVWIWEWILLHKSLDVIWKNPKFKSLFITTSILAVALVESAAIYGLVIAFQILWFWWENALIMLGAWLSIGLTALAAGIWEWMLCIWTIGSMYRNPREKSRDLAFMVLFIALIEVLAIYGLIISFQILG